MMRMEILYALLASTSTTLILASDSLKEIENAKRTLSQTFKMTDLGEISWILGMEVKQDHKHKTITILQEKYINGILKWYGQLNVHPMKTPSLPNEQLIKLKSPKPDVDVKWYQSAVGALMYAMLGTCLDLAYMVGILSQHTAVLGKDHVHTVQCTFRYLHAMIHHNLTFNGNECGELIGFSDTDWAANVNNHHSISGYVFMLSGAVVSWSSKKQGSMALLSTEAEYIAGAHAAKEAIWLRTLLSEFGELQEAPMTLLINNQSTITIVKNPAYHMHTKHIDVRYHFLCEKYASGELELQYVPTGEQLADVLMKGLVHEKHKRFCSGMGVR